MQDMQKTPTQNALVSRRDKTLNHQRSSVTVPFLVNEKILSSLKLLSLKEMV
jgi:hypothetical protein